jgi:Transposase DDE domain/Domain of unknown function (DUF4372)
MKKTSTATPTRCKLSVFRQLCNLIPTHLVAQLARATGVEEKCRSFKPWSHVVSLLFAQFTHAIGLNDVSDSLRLHSGPLSAIRGATPPSRNGLSTANRERPAALAEELFWKTLEHLKNVSPAFGSGRAGKRLAHRFKTAIHIVDATTIQLIACCLDWAKHRRRKAAAKCHLRLDLHSFLPRFALIDTARDNDAKRAHEVCAGIRAGEIVLFDKAYVDFGHLHDLNERGVFWVTRAKNNLQFKVARKRIKKSAGKILRDDEILLTGVRSRADHPQRLRRVVALVEVDGVEREMVFLTNNFQWAASTVAELYRCRWQIEVFFKQIKQTLQLADFLGNSANAVRWQVWTALLTYVLLRYQAFLSRWGSSFVRLWTCVRAALWLKLDAVALLKSYGTAGGDFRLLGQPQAAYLPGFRPVTVG